MKWNRTVNVRQVSNINTDARASVGYSTTIHGTMASLVMRCSCTHLYSNLDVFSFYSAPVGERSIAICLSVCMSVCLCVCLCPRANLWNHWTDLRELFVPIPCGRGSVLLWRRCDTGAESDVYECLVYILYFTQMKVSTRCPTHHARPIFVASWLNVCIS